LEVLPLRLSAQPIAATAGAALTRAAAARTPAISFISVLLLGFWQQRGRLPELKQTLPLGGDKTRKHNKLCPRVAMRDGRLRRGLAVRTCSPASNFPGHPRPRSAREPCLPARSQPAGHPLGVISSHHRSNVPNSSIRLRHKGLSAIAMNSHQQPSDTRKSQKPGWDQFKTRPV
jgi:hypothetical protein